jgi:hypothetical protein
MRNMLISFAMLLLVVITTAGVFSSYSAASNFSNSLPLSLVATVTGQVYSAGNQQYMIQQQGAVMNASIMGFQVVPSTSNLNYLLLANVEGLSTSGLATFSLSGMNSSGWQITVNGTAPLVANVPAMSLPLECSYNQSISCTSVVPAMFSGNATVVIGLSKNGVKTVPETKVIPMMFESSYLNPFGNPIFFGSEDFSSMSVITTYSAATIDWMGVVTTGNVNGTLGKSTHVFGSFVEMTRESENMVTGTARDDGSIWLDQMSPSYLNSAGPYSGSSWIPSSGQGACNGIPLPANACTQTGYSSSGAIKLESSSGSSITGGYHAIWSSPAFNVTSSLSASVSHITLRHRVPIPMMIAIPKFEL